MKPTVYTKYTMQVLCVQRYFHFFQKLNMLNYLYVNHYLER